MKFSLEDKTVKGGNFDTAGAFYIILSIIFSTFSNLPLLSILIFLEVSFLVMVMRRQGELTGLKVVTGKIGG